jgi:hypothetical protein
LSLHELLAHGRCFGSRVFGQSGTRCKTRASPSFIVSILADDSSFRKLTTNVLKIMRIEHHPQGINEPWQSRDIANKCTTDTAVPKVNTNEFVLL